MAKLDIPICLIDESVVDYGFRVLMSGYQPEVFNSNPVMLLQHKRVNDGYQAITDDVVLPLGKWNDTKVQGSKLVGYPEFDDDDDFAKKIQKKVEKGYLNAASVWIEPIEVSDDTALKLPGQAGVTITKWAIREASIVDIPNCRNAVAIRNSAGAKILLNGNNTDDAKQVLDFLNTLNTNTNTSNMDKKLLALKLGLNENATDAEITNKLTAVLTDANTSASYKTEIAQLKTDVTAKETELSALKLSVDNEKAEILVQGAVDAKKIVATDKEKYLKLAKGDYATTKELIDSITPYQSMESKMHNADEASKTEVAELMKLSGRDLYMQGKFERLKQLSVESFKLKYKEYYGAEYKG